MPAATFASECRHVLFTDQAPVDARGWEVRVVPRQHATPARDNRAIKLQPHAHFPGKRTLYLDGNLTLTAPPESALRHLQSASADVAMRAHPRRGSLRAEFDAVRAYNLVNPVTLNALLDRYEHVLDRPIPEANVIAANPTPAARRLFDSWWAEVRDHSPRDQLAYPHALNASRASARLSRVPLSPIVARRGHALARARGVS